MTNDKIIEMGMEGLTCAPNEPGSELLPLIEDGSFSFHRKMLRYDSTH